MPLNSPRIYTDTHDKSKSVKIRVKSVARFLELAAVLFCPALNNNFLIGIELNGVATLPMEVAEKAILPAAEGEICHRRGYADVNSDIAGGRLVAESPRGGTAGCK